MIIAEELQTPEKCAETVDLSQGIVTLAKARAIRWMGWGFGEALIPVFISQFSYSFTQMGFVSATLELASIASLPFIGMLADRIPAKKLILTSLLFYPAVGVCYFISGFFDAALFVILARVINGITWSLENVGISTYYRRATPTERIATSFGYLDTLSNAGWIVSALLSLFVVKFVPTHFFLIAICPFAIAGFFLARGAPLDASPAGKTLSIQARAPAFKYVATHWFRAANQQRLLTALIFISSSLTALTDFFIPINSYRAGANLQMIILLAVFTAIPSLLGFHLGKLTDRVRNLHLISGGLMGVTGVLICIVVFPNYWVRLLGTFFIGAMVELFTVIKTRQVTVFSSELEYGVRGSAFEGITTASELLAPIIIGVSLDFLRFNPFLMVLAGAATLLALASVLRAARRDKSVCEC